MSLPVGDFNHRNVAGACVALVTFLVFLGSLFFVLSTR